MASLLGNTRAMRNATRSPTPADHGESHLVEVLAVLLLALVVLLIVI